MPSASTVQTNFGAGEWSSKMSARSDDPRYKAALRKMLNYQPSDEMACVSRGGWLAGGMTRAGQKARLLDWKFVQTNPLVSEFTPGVMRLWENGQLSLTGSFLYTSVTAANPAVFTRSDGIANYDGKSILFRFTDGDDIQIAPELSERVFEVRQDVGVATFKLIDPVTNDFVDGSAWSGSFHGATLYIITEFPTPYLEDDLPNIRRVQSSSQKDTNNDYSVASEQKVTFLDGSYAPQSISSLGTEWVSEVFSDGPYLDIPKKQIPLQPGQRSGQITFTLAKWDDSITYDKGDIAYFPDYPYLSLQGDNLNNEPPGGPTNEWWTPIPLPWLFSGTYDLGIPTGADTRVMFSQIDANTGHNPDDTSSIYWSPVPPTWTLSITVENSAVFVDPSDGLAYVMYGTDPLVDSMSRPGLDAANWVQFDLATGYATFVAITQGTAFLPQDTGRCIRFFSGPAPWNEDKSYPEDALVLFEGNNYKSLVADNLNLTPDVTPESWELQAEVGYWTWGRLISGSGGLQTETLSLWDFGTIYSQGEIVAWGPACGTGGPATKAYVSLVSSNLGSDPSIAGNPLWIELSSQLLPGPTATAIPYDVNRIYSQGDLVDTGGGVYTVLTDFAGGPDDVPTSSHWLNVSIGTTTGTQGAMVVQLEGKSLPDLNVIYTWRLGLYCASIGFPTCGTYHEGRLWLGGVDKNRFDASVSNDPFNFAPTTSTGVVADNNAISETLNSEHSENIVWFASRSDGLVIGTDAGEWKIAASSLDDPISPTNIQARVISNYGCYNTEPARVPTALAVVPSKQRKLLEYKIAVLNGGATTGYTGDDLIDTSKHLSKGGIAEICYQQEPIPTIWARTQTGGLFGVSYKRQPNFELTAPFSHERGDTRTFESICVQLDDSGLTENVYAVTYTPPTDDDDNPPTTPPVRWVEIMQPIWEGESEDDLPDAFMLDFAVRPSGQVVDVDGGTTTFYGLMALAGQTVAVVLGGIHIKNPTFPPGHLFQWTVGDDGTVTIPSNRIPDATYKCGLTPFIGAPNCPDEGGLQGIQGAIFGYAFIRRGQMLRQQEGSANGPTFGKSRRNHKMGVMVDLVFEISLGTDFDTQNSVVLTKADRVTIIDSSTSTETVSDLASGVFVDSFDTDYDYDNMICWEQDYPMPGTVLAVGGFLNVQDI